jgi:putative PIN family toxin of toxin-antitoxin system
VKVVVDTNTLVSGLLWRGNPSRILDAILDNQIELYASEELLAELREVLCRPRLARFVEARDLNAAWSCDFIQDRCLTVSPSLALEIPELRDRKDLHVLCTAVAAIVDMVITGDKDLLSLKTIAGIPIIDAAQAVKLLGLS